MYRRLMLRAEDAECLPFEILALLGLLPDGSLDQEKLVGLIRLFRPDRDGKLSMIHFVKGVDKVYREMRLLRASVTNSSKIDSAFENILVSQCFAQRIRWSFGDDSNLIAPYLCCRTCSFMRL